MRPSMISAVPAGPSTAIGSPNGAVKIGLPSHASKLRMPLGVSTLSRWLFGTTRVAPLAAVKSSSIQTMFIVTG